MKLFILWALIALLSLSVLTALFWPLLSTKNKQQVAIDVGKKNKAWLVISLFLVPVISAGIYYSLGSSQQLNQYWILQEQNEKIAEQVVLLEKNPQLVISQLKSRLQEKPKSPHGWLLLGKLYLNQGQYAEAEYALIKAYKLTPQNSDIIVSLAKASFFNHKQQLTPALQQLLQTVVQEDPQRIDAINLLAVNAYEHKQYQQAIALWEKLLLQLPAGSQDQQQVLTMIARAEQQLSVSR